MGAVIRPNARFVILPVRHMSVHSRVRAGETADFHGQRPRDPVTGTFARPPASKVSCRTIDHPPQVR